MSVGNVSSNFGQALLVEILGPVSVYGATVFHDSAHCQVIIFKRVEGTVTVGCVNETLSRKHGVRQISLTHLPRGRLSDAARQHRGIRREIMQASQGAEKIGRPEVFRGRAQGCDRSSMLPRAAYTPPLDIERTERDRHDVLRLLMILLPNRRLTTRRKMSVFPMRRRPHTTENMVRRRGVGSFRRPRCHASML